MVGHVNITWTQVAFVAFKNSCIFVSLFSCSSILPSVCVCVCVGLCISPSNSCTGDGTHHQPGLAGCLAPLLSRSFKISQSHSSPTTGHNKDATPKQSLWCYYCSFSNQSSTKLERIHFSFFRQRYCLWNKEVQQSKWWLMSDDGCDQCFWARGRVEHFPRSLASVYSDGNTSRGF